MEVAAKSNSKSMYSWWWDSHNTPKNSKWLQENLADMDSNVKKMIKVLEEDADSFAKRAEMYYRKRPELMKLVEEFYRAYRALAERYNHATGVIHKAHQTISEAFPNQVNMIFGDESQTNDVDPQTPEMIPPPTFRAQVDSGELQKDALGFSVSHVHAVKRNLDFGEESLFVSNGKARKGLNFDIDGRASKAEAEVVALKDSLSKMEAEKEASLAQFEKNLERLSNLESEISLAQENSRKLNDRAASAEAEIQTLRENIDKLESEKESSLLHYQQCLQKIADLEDGISMAHKDTEEITERANKVEAETLTLKQNLAKAETDKEAALVEYRQCLKEISNLEESLRRSEEDARLINERAEKADVEVENLKQTISKLIKDKEASELQYQQCLNIIADLKLKLYHAQEETQRLSNELEDEVAKLKFSEEKCIVLERSNQNLHSELDGLLEKLGNQSQKLNEKQTELVKLWSCVQEEHLHFKEAETAFQTLQQLHTQSQEELNNLAVELQTKSQIMRDIEIRNNELQKEIHQVKVENKGLNELNLSSVASIRSLQEDVSSLKESEVENQHTAIENIVLVEFLRQLNSEAVSNAKKTSDNLIDHEFGNMKDQLREKEKELEAIKIENEKLNHEVVKIRSEAELLESESATVLLNESIKHLEDYVFTRCESVDELSKGADSNDECLKLEDMCLRIKAIEETVMEKEKFLMLENSNISSMLEESLKEVKEFKTGGRRSMRKQEEGRRSEKTRKPSNEIEIVTKDIVLDQTSDGSSYEIINKKDGNGFVELKPVKTHKTESRDEESLIVNKEEIFDGFMDLNREVSKKKVVERLVSDLQKLQNLQITIQDLKNKVEIEKKLGGGEEEYETIKEQIQETEEAIEKMLKLNQKLTTKAESEKENDRRRRISEQARRGSEKIGRLQLEIQRIQFLLMKLEGEKENRNRAKLKVSDTKSKAILRDYIYGGSRSVSMKKTTMKKKRPVFCGCVQQPKSP